METFVQLLDNPWLLALCLILGLVVLVLGADWLVAGASGLAKRFNIPDLTIGMTVVAFGTSMPEFVVNVVSVADGATDFAITNILGSNIFNIFFILGISALVYPIASQKRSRDFDIPMSMIAALLVLIFTLITLPVETTLFSEIGKGMTRWSGVILLLFFVVFLYLTFRHAKQHPEEAAAESYTPMSAGKATLLIIAGLLGLVIGARMIVSGATKIAVDMNVSQAVIGLTILAVGTSLPELATSMMAAFRKNSDIALGNVIGSNIFNIFFILGVSATCRPLPHYVGLERDAIMAIVGSVLVWLFIKANKERKISRTAGAVLVLCYLGYLAYLLANI